jgi:hypothetical protein
MSLSIMSWSFDKGLYNPGDTMTLTVNYTTTDTTGGQGDVAFPITVALSDASSSVSLTSTGAIDFPDFTLNEGAVSPQLTTVSVSDARTPPGTWALVSNTISTSVSPYPGTAVFTSVA